MIRFVLALMIGGGILFFFGYREMSLSNIADEKPQTITAAELIANGPGDNAHVIVTDLYVLDSYAYEGPQDKPNKFDKVWVPAIAMDDPWVLKAESLALEAEERNPDNPDYSALMNLSYPNNIKLVIYSKDLKSAGAVDEFIQGSEVKGLIINEIEDLKGDELKNLKKGYPSLDAKNVLIIEHNRTPAGSGLVMLIMAGGAVLFLAGPGLLLMARKNG